MAIIHVSCLGADTAVVHVSHFFLLKSEFARHKTLQTKAGIMIDIHTTPHLIEGVESVIIARPTNKPARLVAQ